MTTATTLTVLASSAADNINATTPGMAPVSPPPPPSPRAEGRCGMSATCVVDSYRTDVHGPADEDGDAGGAPGVVVVVIPPKPPPGR